MLEWCCNPGSRITRCCRRRPRTKALRLGQHNIDLDDAVQVAKLRQMGLQYLQSQGALRVFVSLPCKSWCQIQSLNVQVHGKAFNDKLQRERQVSQHMIRLFLRTYRLWKRESPAKVYGAFEWPRNCGWNSNHNPAITSLLKVLPQSAFFHGCAFGLKYKGKYLKKPWRIATDHGKLAAALDGRSCSRGHSHTQTIGKAAKVSESYPLLLAQCITNAFLEYP